MRSESRIPRNVFIDFKFCSSTSSLACTAVYDLNEQKISKQWKIPKQLNKKRNEKIETAHGEAFFKQIYQAQILSKVVCKVAFFLADVPKKLMSNPTMT